MVTSVTLVPSRQAEPLRPDGKGGLKFVGCAMQYLNWISGGNMHSDDHPTVHPLLRAVVIVINDSHSSARPLLKPVLNRLLKTATMDTELLQRKMLSTGLVTSVSWGFSSIDRKPTVTIRPSMPSPALIMALESVLPKEYLDLPEGQVDSDAARERFREAFDSDESISGSLMTVLRRSAERVKSVVGVS